MRTESENHADELAQLETREKHRKDASMWLARDVAKAQDIAELVQEGL
ncbi:hypothetical protein [Phaeobacter sp. B1627]|nr:hypothetical protein [Phaeobacter sp. B1627]